MRELFPILVTLCILAAIFGIWYAARDNGWFVNKKADDFSICRTSSDTLSFQRKYPDYGISGWNASRNDDDILHVSFELSRHGNRDQIIMAIDTQHVNYIELYGITYKIKDIPMCK